MRVLVACEYSGIVRNAFAALGHDAWSCDLLPTEKPGQHIQGNVLEVLHQGWDLMIAHPPCTYLSKAGARWLYPKAGQLDPERYQLGLQAKKFLLALLDAPIPRIAVENPTPLKVFNLPQPSQIIQPYEYGEPYSKRTLLWLKRLPKLIPTEIRSDYKPFLRSNTGFGKKKGQRYHDIPTKSGKEASKFFEGIALAMAKQWGELV